MCVVPEAMKEDDASLPSDEMGHTSMAVVESWSVI